MVVCILRSDIDLARHFLITPLLKTFGSRPYQPLNFPLLLCRDVHVICLFFFFFLESLRRTLGSCTFILHTTSFVVGNILLFYRLNPELRAGYLLLSALSEGILRLQLPLYLSRYLFSLGVCHKW